MTLQEAKNIAQEAISRLKNETTDDIFDDGRDSGNFEQSHRFSRNVAIINQVASKLATIEDIDGISEDVLDKAWREARGAHYNSNRPECRYNAAMNYAHSILNL